ncbi:MAG: cyclic nucleotide-binding domain-containing protein [Burkholderiales bacterium]
MRESRPTPAQLACLDPLSSLPADRLEELARLAVVERVERGANPFASQPRGAGAVFLLRGELLLVFGSGGTQVIVGGTDDARYAVNRRQAPLARGKAITDVDIVAIDDEALDIVVTWDQVAASEASGGPAAGLANAIRSDWKLISGMFSLSNLQHGVFSQLPAARIDELLGRFERLPVRRGDVVIHEGDEGDYYYVVESGRCQVERLVGGARMALAELKSGDAFGEEALVSEAKRNATVVVTSDGALLRLGKNDFNELLREPLLSRLTLAEAQQKVSEGAIWLDVRYPSEYQYDKLPGAINVPLNEVRNMFAVLDRSREYVAYCQSGRRSSAAAFLFAQRGFKVWLLDGGLWASGIRT